MHCYRQILVLSLLAIFTSACGVSSPISSSPNSEQNTVITAGMKIDPPIDLPIDKAPGNQSIVLAGGCFWGVEAVFENLRGVVNVVSGFAGGTASTANYRDVSNGITNHAEAVEITYNPQQISLGKLLKIYFLIAHDPTQIDRQEPDEGAQYRSAIFFGNSEQQKISKAYIDTLDKSNIFPAKIATQLVPLTKFYAAEEYHQNFIDRNPNYPYVVVHDLPKLNRLRQQFPDLIKR